MKYFELSQDEFSDDDRPGLSSDVARKLLASIASQVEGEGRMDVLGVDTGGPIYYVMLEHPNHITVFTNYLTRRNIWHEIHDHLPGARPEEVRRDITQGVIFFRLTRQQIQPRAVRGAVHSIAAMVDEMFGFPLHANFFAETEGVYWVGFNDVGAGQMFAMFLRSQGLPIVNRDALFDGRRPTGLPLVEFQAAQQAAQGVPASPPGPAPQRRRRQQPLPDGDEAEGRGFAVMAEIVRRKLRSGDGPGFRAKMEKRLSERFGFTPRGQQRRGDEES